MFKPSLKSNWTLLVLAIVAYGLYNWAEYSRVDARQPHYDEKLAAAELMLQGMDVLRESSAPEAAIADEINDPFATMLVGQKNTLITTLEGNHAAKLMTVNPNTAAMMVDLFYDAGLERGDKLAMCVSGSFPALNLAAFSACKIMGIDPVIITSVSSSWYGATDPLFTWLDMEAALRESGLFDYKSIAASAGGADDRGRSLPPEGRALLRQAVERNDVPYLNPPSVDDAIRIRVDLFTEQLKGSPAGYGTFLNIGGGVASLGHVENGQLLPLGVIKHVQPMNYPREGVIHYFSRHNVPVINLKYRNHLFEKLLQDNGLPLRFNAVPEPGDGATFVTERYDLRVVLVAVLIMTVLVLVVIRFDLRLQQLREANADPDDMI